MAAIRLPRISNSTDVEALACEPGVLVRWVTDPADLADADVVVIPGSKATVADLAWLRDRGLADGVVAHAAIGQAGAGHLRRLPDAVPAHRRPRGVRGRRRRGARSARRRHRVRARQDAAAPRQSRCTATRSTTARCSGTTEDDWLGVGIRRGAVYGTHWHGLLDNDDVRRQWLDRRRRGSGPDGFVVADDVDVSARRDAQLDLMADLLAAHIDIDAILALLENGPPQRPTVVAGTSG